MNRMDCVYDCVVTIRKREVVYDVDFTSWKVAQCRISDAAARGEAQTDEENHDWMLRQIETAVCEIKRVLSVYLSEDRGRIRSNEIGEVNEWCIGLHMEKGWRGRVDLMSSYIHRYIVDYALAEWFKIVMPEEMEVYSLRANEWLDKLNSEARNVVVSNIIFRM